MGDSSAEGWALAFDRGHLVMGRIARRERMGALWNHWAEMAQAGEQLL